jgi:hydroxyethylthiazole kinase-like uncharacterized protein yjeF
MKILTVVQIGEVDRLTTDRYLIPSLLLMENAGRSVVDELEAACPGLYDKRIAIFCGRGNNGGDGFVVARYLTLRGASPTILLFSAPDKLRGDAKVNWDIVNAMGLQVAVLPTVAEAKSFLRKMPFQDVVVDALFGTGLSKPVDSNFRPVVEWINNVSSRAFVAAVDIPSGIMADTHSIPGPAVRADMTVTFSALKLAHVLPPALDAAGRVVLARIGSPAELFENPEYRLNLVDEIQVRKTLPQRPRDSHKGKFGHVYVVAGSRGKSGAALMTGLAALRSGAGLATLWAPESLQRDFVGKFPELMTESLPETEDGTSAHAGAGKVLKWSKNVESLVVGPGLTTHPDTQKLVWDLVQRSPVPVVLDADGINALATAAGPLKNRLKQPIVMTPHPGEMARLAGIKTSEVQDRRLETACECAGQLQYYVVLKGFRTVIATPKGDVYINPTGNPGMATGGTGDVLAGMIGRFIAGWNLNRKNPGCPELVDFLCAAVYLHGLAGDLAAESMGEESLVATDLLGYLHQAFRKVRMRE